MIDTPMKEVNPPKGYEEDTDDRLQVQHGKGKRKCANHPLGSSKRLAVSSINTAREDGGKQ